MIGEWKTTFLSLFSKLARVLTSVLAVLYNELVQRVKLAES